VTEIRDRADDAVSLFDWSRCVCVVVLDYTCCLGWEGRNTNSYPAISIFEMILRRRDRETERPGAMCAGKDTWSQAGEAGEEREVRKRRRIPSLPKFLDLNRSKRSGLRGECRAKAADLAEGARAGEGRRGGIAPRGLGSLNRTRKTAPKRTKPIVQRSGQRTTSVPTRDDLFQFRQPAKTVRSLFAVSSI
jgi:hypothetical protein